MSFEIEVSGGSSVRLPTAGKYCDRDIVVTATGGGGGALETCNVHLLFVTESEGGNRIHVAYSTIENGKPVSTELVFGKYYEMIGWVYPEQREYDIEVLCGSNIIVYDDNWSLASIGGDLSGFTANGARVMFAPSGTTSASCNISFF